ncbi:MAG: hypothetical protein WC954_05955 [Sphaerochaeta sp.]
MTKEYQHSETFNVLKATHEEISKNLTSSQYLQTLDFFLWNAVAPIVTECRPFFNGFIAKCVSTQTLNPGTKFASDKNTLPELLFELCNTPSADKAMNILKKMRFNRGVMFAMINVHQRLTSGYKELHSLFSSEPVISRVQQMRRIEQSVGCNLGSRLYTIMDQIEYWDDKARWFKGLIVQKYTRMAMIQAQRTYVQFNHEVPLDDVSQIYLLIVNKAIDRCDSRLGVLTTFINGWLPTARAMVAKLANHPTESYENLTELNDPALAEMSVIPDFTFEDLQHLAYQALEIDPVGIVRTSLGIPQYASSSQHRQLIRYIKHEL